MKALWSAKWYLLLGLFSYILFLVATAPLDFVWRQAQPYVGRLPVQIQQVSGTLWQGQAKVQVPQVGALNAKWTLDAFSLLAGKANLDLDVKGNAVALNGNVQASPSQIILTDVNGSLSSQHLRSMLRQGQVKLAGEFEVSGLNAELLVADKQIASAEGRIVYSGGDVGFPIDGKPINATLPMLVGQISKPSDKVELSLATTEGLSIGSGYLQPDGWGGVAIKRRFLDILGQKWPAKATEDTVIFEVSQKLL